jgi:hypothetical protein
MPCPGDERRVKEGAPAVAEIVDSQLKTWGKKSAYYMIFVGFAPVPLFDPTSP